MWLHEFEAVVNELRSRRRVLVHEENRTVVFSLWFADQATLNFILSQRIPVGCAVLQSSGLDFPLT